MPHCLSGKNVVTSPLPIRALDVASRGDLFLGTNLSQLSIYREQNPNAICVCLDESFSGIGALLDTTDNTLGFGGL